MCDWKFDYYRMTGKLWSNSLIDIKNFILIHNTRYMYWWIKSKKGSVYVNVKFIDALENMG